MRMNRKIILTFLCVISLIEGTKIDAKQETIANLTSKIADEKTKVEEIYQAAENLLRQTRKFISQTIIEAKTSQPQLDDVSLGLSNVHIQKLEDCSKDRALDTLNRDFFYLESINRRLSNVIDYCFYKRGQNLDDVTSCADTEIGFYARKLELLRYRFNIICEDAIKRVVACTEEIVKKLDKIIVVPRF